MGFTWLGGILGFVIGNETAEEGKLFSVFKVTPDSVGGVRFVVYNVEVKESVDVEGGVEVEVDVDVEDGIKVSVGNGIDASNDVDVDDGIEVSVDVDVSVDEGIEVSVDVDVSIEVSVDVDEGIDVSLDVDDGIEVSLDVDEGIDVSLDDGIDSELLKFVEDLNWGLIKGFSITGAEAFLVSVIILFDCFFSVSIWFWVVDNILDSTIASNNLIPLT